MIEIVIDDRGTISQRGMIPGQVIFLTMPDGKCWRITRWGPKTVACLEKE